jgi:hypothetical protein
MMLHCPGGLSITSARAELSFGLLQLHASWFWYHSSRWEQSLCVKQ